MGSKTNNGGPKMLPRYSGRRTIEQARSFFLFERCAGCKNRNADKIPALWDKLNLADFICDMYESYHCKRLLNAFDDIDSLIAERSRIKV